MRGPVTSIPVGNYISQGCVNMNRECVSRSPCRNGLCINGVGRYFCDCAGTEYAGSLCNDCKYFIIEPEYRVMINTGSLFDSLT